jgi:hypothetical protein
MDNMEKSFAVIQELIDRAFNRFWSSEKDAPASKGRTTALYESVKDYSSKTGKRFRMTKDQKSRGLSRDEAFEEFVRTVS